MNGSQKVSFSFCYCKTNYCSQPLLCNMLVCAPTATWQMSPPVQDHMENGKHTEREQWKKCMVLSSSCVHQTQNPLISKDCPCVQCKCDIHSVSVEMLPCLCKRLDECHGQGQKQSSFIIKHTFQSHRRNAVGGHTGTAALISHTATLGIFSMNISVIMKSKADKH